MSQWTDIRCEREHAEHRSMTVAIDLARRHGYSDSPQVPAALAARWRMRIWHPGYHPVDGGSYCPAHDVVSETILSHRIWEPIGTIVAGHVLTSGPGMFLDFGAQLGWYALLAAAYDRFTVAVEADADNAALLAESLELNGWHDRAHVVHARVGREPVDIPLGQRVRLVKIDVEGAEPAALDLLWPLISAGLVDYLLIEISPVFHDRYPAMVQRLLDVGYEALALPSKQRPPVPRVRLDALTPITDGIVARVPDWHQQDVLFRRGGAL